MRTSTLATALLVGCIVQTAAPLTAIAPAGATAQEDIVRILMVDSHGSDPTRLTHQPQQDGGMIVLDDRPSTRCHWSVEELPRTPDAVEGWYASCDVKRLATPDATEGWLR